MTFVVIPAAVVVDASVAVDLALGERAETAAAFTRWIDRGSPLYAPPTIWPEAGHAILRAMRHDAVRAGMRLEELAATGVETVDRGLAGLRMALALAERHRLSVYDATYLWLAIDVDAELATWDRDLARAAAAEGVALALARSS